MADLPNVSKTASKAVDAVKNTLSILDKPMSCKHCGATTEPSRAYDPQEASFYSQTNGERPTWYCENCDTHYRREEDGVTSKVFARD